jgi:enoyl-CoA hydratase/carnithine racemase
MLGEPFGPETAEAAGLVNAVVPAGDALDAALAKAKALAALPAVSVAATKRALKAGQAEIVARTLMSEAETFHALRRGPDAQAAFAAFFARNAGR